MGHRFVGIVGLAIVITFLVQCKGSHPAAGSSSIEGDIYLMNNAGDVESGATIIGLVVPSAALESRFRTACDLEKRPANAVMVEDSLAIVNGRSDSEHIRTLQNKLNHFLAILAIQASHREGRLIEAGLSSRTAFDAHYSFSGVRPGKYFLVLAMRVQNAYKIWTVPVSVTAGQHLRADLDDNKVGAPVSCEKPIPFH